MFVIDVKLVIAGMVFALLLLFVLFFLLKRYLYYPIKAHLFKYKLYQYKKIYSSGGTGTKIKWHKTDKKALKDFTWFEFVDIVYPEKHKKRIRPSR